MQHYLFAVYFLVLRAISCSAWRLFHALCSGMTTGIGQGTTYSAKDSN